MATKKVKKFGRGGDILTGVGAVLVGKALYDKYKGGSKDDDYTSRVKEYGTKGRYPEEKTEEKADKKDAKKEESQREEYKAVGNEGKEGIFKDMPKYKEPEGPAAQDVSGKKSVRVLRNKDDKKDDKKDDNVILPATDTYAGATKSSTQHAEEINKIFKGVQDPNKGKYRNKKADASIGAKPGKDAYKDSSGTTYNERGEPFAESKGASKSVQDRGAQNVPAVSSNAAQSDKDKDKKYGIGPYGAFSSIHKAISDYKTPAQINAENKKKKAEGKKAGGAIKKYASGGSVKASKMGSVKTAKPTMRSASSRADGIAIRGKTRA